MFAYSTTNDFKTVGKGYLMFCLPSPTFVHFLLMVFYILTFKTFIVNVCIVFTTYLYSDALLFSFSLHLTFFVHNSVMISNKKFYFYYKEFDVSYIL